jgi:enediyne biosynthesis protein E4
MRAMDPSGEPVPSGRPTTRRPRLAIGVAILVVVVVAAAGIGGYVALGGGGGGLGAPHFVDETASAGIDQTYDGGPTSFVGGGVAFLDCDGDGKPDLYIAGGANPAALYRNVSPVGGALKFAKVDDAATAITAVNGAYPIDVNGDGIVDLAVLRLGGAELFRGLGDCRFAPADDQWSFDGGHGWATAFSATWEGDDGLPTLAVGNYLKLDPSGQETYDCDDSALVRPKADGSGYDRPIPLSPGYCTLSMLFSDWSRSGRADLRVTNDRQYYRVGSEQLWRVEPGQPPRQYTAADGWQPMQIWGMGIASYDIDGDGYPDVYLTSQGDNKLQALSAGPGRPAYHDIALARGVTVAQPFTGGETLPSTAWHPEFQDVNNDGFIDLFVSKGNVSTVPDYAQKDPSDLLLGRPDGTFTEAAGAAGIVDFDRGRGAALADFNLDGLLDLVEVNLGAPVRLWRNVGAGDAAHPAAMGHWLGVGLSQPGPDRDAIGAWLEVQAGSTTQRREVTIGGGHISGQLGWIHVGLGSATEARVRVTWPDGEVGPWQTVGADGFVDIARGAAAARPWQPGG